MKELKGCSRFTVLVSQAQPRIQNHSMRMSQLRHHRMNDLCWFTATQDAQSQKSHSTTLASVSTCLAEELVSGNWMKNSRNPKPIMQTKGENRLTELLGVLNVKRPWHNLRGSDSGHDSLLMPCDFEVSFERGERQRQRESERIYFQPLLLLSLPRLRAECGANYSNLLITSWCCLMKAEL